ncbi:helix-turn-helix domain-containing protein [Cytophagaceae bacterium YF14B1]|uniref:Helix-turn-helix domain-containing protein n=1 Tax=Xanthocytophaga flava TaxID=3048013 RepID=A0AAE3QJ09_9BACT|nr:helix-turn-helix domain-containing protein [Xanthocytophaga flavus]MDJ1480217.1 helix-turn-helix domain-containing protein [Xanthocytophaga flavus]
MSNATITELPGYITADLQRKGFKVHEILETVDISQSHRRRDYYKIVLATGNMTIYYGDQVLDINDTFLFFSNPHIPHAVVHHTEQKKGYACIFTEAFMAGRDRELLQNSPLFRVGTTPLFFLTKDQTAFLTSIYQKMLAVHNSPYDYKDELIRNCIELIIHEALQMQPVPNGLTQRNAASRIAWLFMELLERQFPIESPKDPLRLRTAQDFAESLSVHINYLNRLVKEVTGKPTSVHIAERIATEAKALLQHSNWSVADIAYGLGFEYTTYFNNYFKRVTGATPNSFRKKKV